MNYIKSVMDKEAKDWLFVGSCGGVMMVVVAAVETVSTEATLSDKWLMSSLISVMLSWREVTRW